jgi:hypothetical protein
MPETKLLSCKRKQIIQTHIKFQIVLLISILLAGYSLAEAQFAKDRFGMYFSGSYAHLNNPEGHLAANLSAQFFYTERFSIEARIGFSNRYLHVPAATLLGMIIYEAAAINWLVTGKPVPRYVILFFGESYSFHFPLGRQISLSPYAAPWSFDAESSSAYYSEFALSLTSGLGLRMNWYARNRFSGNLFCEYRYDYIGKQYFSEFGISAGFSLPGPEKKENLPEDYYQF